MARVSIVNCVSTALEMLKYSTLSAFANARTADWDYVLVTWLASDPVKRFADNLASVYPDRLHLVTHETDDSVGYVPNLRAMMNDDLANILRKHFGDDYPFPRKQGPKFLFWLIAPMRGFTRKYVSRNAGIQIKLDNSYSKKDLSMSYRPIEQTVKEHFQQLLDDGLLGKTPI